MASWIQLVVVTMETKLVEEREKRKKQRRTMILPIFASGGGWRWRGVRG